MRKHGASELTLEQSAVFDDLIDHMFDPGCAKATEVYHLIPWERITDASALALMIVAAHEQAEQHKDWCFVHRSKLVH